MAIELTNNTEHMGGDRLVIRFSNASTGEQISIAVKGGSLTNGTDKTYDVMADNEHLESCEIQVGTVATLLRLPEWGKKEKPKPLGEVKVRSLIPNGTKLTGIVAVPSTEAQP